MPGSGVPLDGLPTGTVTFLRSDIEGSMRLVRSLGARFDDVHATHQSLVRQAVAGHGGREVRTEGDSFLIAFDDAGNAVRAAVEIQSAVAGHDWPAGAAVRLRIGLHTGSAHRAGDDYGGFEVGRAARIAATASGGQIVLSDAVRALVATDLPPGTAIRDLGYHRLKDVADPERLFQLDVDTLPTSFPPLRGGLRPAPGNLPARLTDLVGRDEELAALAALLGTHRLVTLTGPGGTGKTSLAVELGRRAAAGFADGAWFVDLASVGEPGLVRAAIARTLGLHDGPADTAAARLAAHVADRSLLLVLDNLEHLLDAAPDVLDLLSVAAGLTVVATSRAPLRVTGEQEFRVRPLETDVAAGVSGAASEPAADRLFLERARAVHPMLVLSQEDRTAVHQIVTTLDGLPLGIELAAARVAALPVHAIAERLATRRPLPGSGPRDLPRRHRTLEDTIDWSHDLLDGAAQRLLAELSVFVGGFDVDQAEAVCGQDDDAGRDVLDTLVTLVEQSLLLPVPEPAAGVRFRLLDTIREYAARRLRERGDEARLAARHARAYMDLARLASGHDRRGDQAEWLRRLSVDDANLRAAMEWAIGAGDAAFGMRLGRLLWRYWVTTGRLVQGRELMARVMAMPAARTAPADDRLAGLDAAGSLAYYAGDTESARQLYDEQFDVAVHQGDLAAEANAAFNVAHSRFVREDPVAAREAAALALEKYEAAGDDIGAARARWTIAAFLVGGGDPAGELDMEAARSQMLDLRRRFHGFSDVGYESMAADALAMIAMHAGDIRDAGRWVMRTVAIGRPMGDVAGTTIAMRVHAVLLSELGDPEGAAVLLGAYEALSELYGVRPPASLEQVTGWTEPGERLAERLEPEVMALATDRGRRLSVEEALDYLVRAMERLGIEPADG